MQVGGPRPDRSEWGASARSAKGMSESAPTPPVVTIDDDVDARVAIAGPRGPLSVNSPGRGEPAREASLNPAAAAAATPIRTLPSTRHVPRRTERTDAWRATWGADSHISRAKLHQNGFEGASRTGVILARPRGSRAPILADPTGHARREVSGARWPPGGPDVGGERTERGERMGQTDVERTLGRLLTDAGFRRDFFLSPARACLGLGVQLAPQEVEALLRRAEPRTVVGRHSRGR
jgi:hypothetical protein